MNQLKFKLHILIALSLLAACSSPAAAPTATLTATPPPSLTFTPSPTLTPTNTATPTVVPSNTPRPTATATPVPQPGDVLMTDTFEDQTDNSWRIWREGGSISEFQGGVLSLQVRERNVFYFSNAASRFEDVDMTFTATLQNGAASNTMLGGQCRVKDDRNFYLFAISGTGNFTIAKYVNNDYKALVSWRPSNAIRTGKATNTLRIVCAGEVLQFWVNDVRLVTVHDDEFQRGKVGLVAGTFDSSKPDSKVSFDDLTVTLPDTVALALGSTGGAGTSGGTSDNPAATAAPQATAAPAATASGTGQLFIVMCQDLETSVTIFHDGQIFKQESLHRAGTNVYDLPPGHYDVQFNTEGYYNLNLAYDIVPGSQYTQYIGHNTC